MAGFACPLPLAGSNIAERHTILTRSHSDLCQLEMPNESPGDRPWRTCLLTSEERDTIIPVDPSKAVRITPRETLPSWMDPFSGGLRAGASIAQRSSTLIRLI